MPDKGKTAYITGGASGIGRAVAEMLAKRGSNIILADKNIEGVKEVSKHLVNTYSINCYGIEVDVADWEPQAEAFRKASSNTRIDYVFPIAGIGEKSWVKNDPNSKPDSYEMPNLEVRVKW
jgi:NAD(P)-dependent dehydrogenase (short-subunit alcohol dehydrogenase family)